MKDSELQFDRTCHAIYSKICKKLIQQKIALHYPPEQRDEIWTQVQHQFADFLSDWRTDLGGSKNFHNKAGGTYDAIAVMAYYVTCRNVTTLSEVEEIEREMLVPSFRKLKFVNCNKPLFKKLLHTAFMKAQGRCEKWHDYEMHVSPYDKEKPIYYDFTVCPICEFAKQHNLLEVMPAMCNPDYDAMAALHARLVRKTTCANGELCDYTICGDQDPYLKDHPEYVDEAGYRRNR